MVRLLRLALASLGFVLYTWIAAVRSLPQVRARKTQVRARKTQVRARKTQVRARNRARRQGRQT
jgi:hypothetical protein